MNTDRKDKAYWTRKLLDTLIGLLIIGCLGGLKVMWNMNTTLGKVSLVQEKTVEAVAEIQKQQKTQEEHLVKLDVWKAETSANRFTVEDGHAIWKDIAVIRETLASLPTEVPPEWFLHRVERLENENREIMEELHKLQGYKK